MDSETKDVSAIQDEDVLRRLWQQTEDFGRKKEIRAHMYKLREARLKEFYTSGEVLKDVQRSNSSPGLREQHSEKNNQKWVEGGVTHADSLADHSFLSLKSKEIRDSESPTREVQFKNSRNRCENDGTWTVASKTTKSEDGKMITNTQVAATHGSRPIDDGNKSYAAINQQQTSVYTDGDANNFTKAIGESSKSFAQEQTVSGDENNFRTSKTVSSSSSSKFVSHSSSTTGDINIDGPFSKQLQIEDSKSGTTKIIHHGDVNIDDYSVGKHQTESTTKKSVSSKTQREVQEGSSSKTVTSRVESSYAPQIDQNKSTTVITRTIQSSEIPEDLQKSINDGNTKVTTETKTLPDGSTVTTTRYETKGSKKWSATSGSTQVTSSSNRQVLEQKSSSSTNIDQKHITDGKQNKTVITTATKVIDNYPEAENIKLIKTDRHDGQDIHITKKQNVEHVKNVESKVTHKDVKVQENNVANQTVKVIKTITTEDDQLQPVVKQVPQIEKQTHVTTSKTTTIKTDVEQADNKKIQDVGTKRDVPQKKEPKQPVKETTLVEPTKSCKPPAETYKPSEPTEGQYSTTYRAEFTPKRISVELGPQHDAFARSLRCKSPDHTSERPNSRQSTSSLRSSTSPEKLSPSRKSPERKPSYDRRSPDKYPSEVERKHNTSPSRPVEYSPERNRKSPERNYSSTITSETKTYNTDTITRRKSSSTRKSPERPITTSPVRSYSPTKSSPTKSGPSSPVKSSPTSPTKSTDVIITTKITRTSTLPEKTSPRGKSPTKQDRSPTKPKAPSDIPTYNSDTITRKKKPTQDIPEDGNKISKPIDLTIQTTEKVVTKTGTLTKRKPEKPTSRDASPTTSVSDFEFVISNNSHIVTDLDEPETNKLPENQRPTSLDINISTTTVTNTKKTKSSSPVKEIPRKLSKQSPTKSPVKETTSPVKDYKPSAPEEDTPSYIVDEIITSTNVTSVCTKPDEPKEKPPLKRTETYEERCRKILGLPEPDKPIIKDEIIPQEYAGKTPVEEPLFVKKHIDYGHPEDDLIHKTTEKIRNRKAERKEPVDITEFISVERNIENEIMPVEDTLPEPKKPKSSSPGRKSPEKQKPQSKNKHPRGYSTEDINEFIEQTADRTEVNRSPQKESPGRKSPEKQKPQSKNKHPGGYSTEDINEFIEQTTDRTEVNRSPQKESPGRKSPEKQKPQSKTKHPGGYSTEDINEFIEQTADRTEVSRSSQKETDDIPHYMRPIPKISPEERDKMILEIRQREISPDKEPKRKPTEGEYTTEYTDEFIEKTTDKRTRKSPTPKHFTTEGQYTTEYTDEYGEITTGTKRSPIKPKTTPDIIKPDTTKISETYKQIEVPVRAKSPPKKPEKKKSKTPTKPKDKKPVDDESSTTDDESENVEAYYETEIKSKDKRISRKSPSPVRRVPDSDRDSPSRSLPEDKTVTEYINEYCKDTKEQDETIIRTETDFISNEKYDTDITLKRNDAPKRKSPEKQIPDIEFNLEKENEQREHIRTHRIDTTDEIKVSPREESPKRVPHKTECTIKKTTTVTENGYSTPKKDVKPTKKPQKPLSPEDQSKSPTKPIKDTKKEIIRTTATKVITKKSSADVIDTTLKKRLTTHKIPKDKSPERRRSPSPTHKTITKKVIETEQITRKCSKKEIPIKNIPERKPIKQIPKSSQPIKTTETPKKHVVTKNISLTSPKSQPTSPVKETRSFSPTKTSPKSITTVKTTKVTHPATITVTKTTKTTTKNIKQKPKDVEQTDTDSELDIENLKTVINNKTSTNRKVVTTAKINVTSPKQPAVQMPAIQVNTNQTDHEPITILIDTNNKTITTSPSFDNNQPTSDSVTTEKQPNIKKLTHKCISTKSIVLNNSIDDLDITVDLQRSTSSREPSPDKICPIPVSSDDEFGHPRYPDQVSEPDDTPSRKKPQKITNIPLTEGEDVKDFNRITEVTETETITTKRTSPRITDIDRVTETDESLLSVTEKVSKFINSAEKLTDDDKQPRKPSPKIPRSEIIITDDLKEDECLLSVTDKVTKFINTADNIATKKPSRTQSPVITTTTTANNFKVEENDDCLKSVNEKVSHFIHAAENIKPKRTSPKEGPAPKVTRPEFTDLDETLKTDECLLSVSDKVSKFLTTAEKLTTETSKTKSEIFINKEKEVESERKPKTFLFHSPSRKSPEKEMPQRKSPERKYPERESPERKSPERKYPERESPERKYPERYSPDRKYSERESPERKSPERNYPKRESPEKELFVRKSPEKTPCSKTNRPKSEPIQPLDTKPLKSSEAVKKAKAMFENISKTQEVPKQRDILSRPSVWEGRKKPEQTPATDLDVKLTDIGVYKKPETKTTEIRKKLNYNEKTDLKDVTLKSTKLILNENKLNKPCDVGIHIRTSSPERDDIPGYMRPIPKVTTEERDQLIIETRLRESVTPERETYKKVVTEHEERTTEVLRSKPIENGDLPGYMRPLQRCLSPEREHKKSVHEEEEIVVETTPPKRSYSPPERDVPGYMKPLQRNVSPDRDGYKPRDSEESTSPALDDTPRAGKKFGVILRRTDSGRMVPTERKRSSIPGEPVIEDIQDLEILEKMMDKVVGYEQRRRIRAQIRIVKKLISENKINISKRVSKTTYSTREQISSTDRRSPSKKLVPTKERSKSPETKKLQSKTTRERSLSPDLRKPTCYSPPERDNRTKIMRDRSASPEFKTRTNITENTYKYSTRSEKIESRSSRERSISPEIKKSTSTTSKVYKTDLKHVQPVNKTKTVQDDKPSWITNRNLKKTMAETVTEKKIIVPPKTKQTPAKRAPSPQKELKPTDCITSSYGIGPTDENGLPLFGIKALRKATTDNVQVRGTVVTSQFYSENGGEPVGEVTVTKYSSDPKELNIKDTKNKGFTSVTTTQKFGTRGVPTLSALTDKKKAITDKKSEEDELIKTTSTKVTRRGSVKALSQKFVENAAEIAAKEKQITYPKAGLILRTSSFKDSTQSFTERTRTTKSSSRESSPGYQSRPTKISLESITSDSRNFASTTTTEHCEDTKTFLNSNTRVANAQDVITRMKNAEKEHHEGDSVEDREARMLLNKFLGAQVLMTGMEPLLGTGSCAQSAVSSSAQLVRKVQKSKTTTSSSTSSSKIKDTGKQLSIKQRFQCPITPEVLQDIWDEQTLRALLEQCTDYEERRAIRARLRQVMAEQEAVANVISSAVSERESSDNRQSVHGESLLLPLLQELLDKKCAHQQSQQQQQQQQQQQFQQQNLMNRSASSQSSEESQTATVDSGTESGEDLRFLAVGLCDSIDSTRAAGGGIEPLGPGLLAEVQHALSRLAMSLQIDSTDVDLEPGRKQSLLQLVARLQSSLVVQPKPPTERRGSGGHGRFSKHKNRQNRHTVGVSSEELAAARKLMQEVVLRDNISVPATPPDKTENYQLQKQLSDGATPTNAYRPMNYVTPVKNATAKPFSSNSKSPTNFSFSADQQMQSFKSVSEPVTPNDFSREKITANLRQTSLNLESESYQTPYYQEPQIADPSYYDVRPEDPWNVQKTYDSISKISNVREFHESETDDDSSTVKQSEEYESARQSLGSSPTHLHYVTDVKTINRITPINDYNNDYNVPKSEENLSAAQRLLNLAINDDSKTTNRFNNKKLKMKRANTIDIPKPLNYYENDDESDDSILDRDDSISSSRRSNYLALRGPIRVGGTNKSTVPTFEPKTENDKKFMAFIQKHNNNNQNVSSIWMNKTTEPAKRTTADHNWSRKFGNIKTIFEKDEGNSRPSSVSSAKQFWQTADDAVNAGKRSYVGPKVNKQGTRQLQSLFEQKQQESKLPWAASTESNNNIVTGTLKVESNFKPIQQSQTTNQLIQGKNYKFIPQPLPVNKFSHAPMSAFKPPQKRSTPVQQLTQSFNYPPSNNITKSKNENTSEPTTPLFLYTPKHLEFPQVQPEEPKPTGTAPWATGHQGEHRVLSIAASKFENPSREISPQPIRKTSKDKVHIPPILQTNSVENSYHKQPYSETITNNKELSSPYLVKSLQPNKSVRKLSGEYDNIVGNNNKIDNIVTYKQPAPQNQYKSINDRNQQVQTVQKNVQKFSTANANANTAYDYPKQEPKINYHKTEEHLNHMNYINGKADNYRQPVQKVAQQPAPQKPARRASGEYNFSSNDSYKSQIPYQISNETSQVTQKSLKPLLFEFPDSESSTSTAATPDNLDEPEVVTSPLTEYKAVSKVMTGPVSQQAVTVTQNTPKTREDHDMARSLQKVLKNISLGDDLDERKNERFETSKNTFSEGPITTTKEVTTRVISKQQVSKPMSPFAKFRQLDKQNSLNTPPSSPRTPTGSGAPLFKFTDPALSHSASTVKDRLLHWCQMKTREYENVKLENFSTSWADGLAFCALIHHFLPNAFDYHALTPQQRRHNFTLAFKVADEQAGIFPLLDVDDMVAMRRPDWKCVFTYVQAIYRRFKDED